MNPRRIAILVLWIVFPAALAVSAGTPAKPIPLRLGIELQDGSVVVGTTDAAELPLNGTPIGDLRVPLNRVHRIEFSRNRPTVKVLFRNGDTLSGAIALSEIELATLFGSVSIPVERIVRITEGQLLGLVACYPLNGNANDASGHGNHGTIHGTTLTDDRFGNANRAYFFDGQNDYIDCGAGETLQVGGRGKSWSTAYWIKRAEAGKIHHMIGMGSAQYSHAVAIGINEANKHGVNFFANEMETYKAHSDVNEWHHWVVTYNGVTNARKMYRDGILAGEDKAVEDFLGSGNVYIGQAPWGARFCGVIDAVRFYNRSLSESEIRELYRMEKEEEESPGVSPGNATSFHLPRETFKPVPIEPGTWRVKQ